MDIQYYFKDYDLDHKLYLILNSVFNNIPFDHCELMFMLNLLLNMATGGEFYILVEKYLFCKDFVVFSTSPSLKKSFNSNLEDIKFNIKTQSIIEKSEKISLKKLNTINDKYIDKSEEKSSIDSPISIRNLEKSRPLFLHMSSVRMSKSPMNDSSSLYLRQPLNQKFLHQGSPLKSNASSPERKSKKYKTLSSPKTTLTRLNFHKKVSTLMATHYDREIVINEALINYMTNFADISKYIRIKIPYFIDMILRFLYEIPDLGNHVKMFYINVFKNLLIDNVCFNAAFLSKDFVIIRLLLCLRIETEEVIRDEINKILALILGNYMNNHQLKAIFHLLHHNVSINEYCQSYLYNNRSKLNSKFAHRGQINALLSSELDCYSNSINLHQNYFDGIQSLLQLLIVLIQQSSENEKSQKQLNFSGQNSGIVITNMRFPITGFSLMLELVFDNLLTCDKRKLSSLYSSSKTDDLNLQKEISPKEHLLFLDQKKFIDTNKEKEPIKEKYLPQIISLVSSDSNNFLEIYLNEKRELNIELIDKNKGSLCHETFRHCFEERKKYSILITSNNESFQVFINNEEIPSNKVKFHNLTEKFLYPKYFSICCSPVKIPDYKTNKKSIDYKKLLPLTIENSLSGTIHSFKLIDKALTPKDIPQCTQKSLNLNLFEFLLKHNFMSENIWISLGKSEPCFLENQQVFVEERIHSRLDLLNRFMNRLNLGGIMTVSTKSNTNPIDNQPFDVKCKGVSYLEKISFLDFLLMFGNVEVFFFMIDLLATDLDFFENEKW